MTKKVANKVVSPKEKRPRFKGDTVQQILDSGTPLLRFRLGRHGRKLFFRTMLRHDLLVAAYECYLPDSADWCFRVENVAVHCDNDILSQIDFSVQTGEEDEGDLFIGAADDDYCGDDEERYSTDLQQYGSWQEARNCEAKVIGILTQFVAGMKAYASDKKNHDKIYRRMIHLRCKRERKSVPEQCLHEYSL